MFEACPQQFLWSKGWGLLDVGAGPGRKKPIPFEKSKHHAIMGIAIQAAVEALYNNELWRHPKLLEALLEIAEKTLKLELHNSYVDFRLSPTRDELWRVIKDGVTGYLKTLKQHRLVGPYARAEVDLTGYLRKWLPIGGRADTIIRRDDTGITIIDGKNGQRYKTKDGYMTYTDPDQLRWYALCFYIAYQKLVDRLGFVYYRYPCGTPILDDKGQPVLAEDGTPKVEDGVEWVPYTKEDLKGLAERAIHTRQGMDKERFDAKPVPSHCKMCDYETVCPPRQAQRQANSRSKKPNELLDGMQGITEFTL
ncbi:MAG: hypothetical protein A2Y38_08145 [Spirochaetes bacterium GWB1_59_5]|nr:MAG: hypothetical protein A2Y38_08145 [Spirochaetes bacterium GWB1_59_5]